MQAWIRRLLKNVAGHLAYSTEQTNKQQKGKIKVEATQRFINTKSRKEIALNSYKGDFTNLNIKDPHLHKTS